MEERRMKFTATHEQTKRLHELQLRAVLHQSILTQLADECCEVLNLDPNEVSYATGTARSVVDAGVSATDAVAMITIHYANHSFDEAANT